MGQQQSKDELLYQQINYGNVEGIKSLCRDGAGLEYIDRDGKTPLILASMNPDLYNVAKTLIELGAKVNAYRPGRNAGTPLHHAAKRGLENTVKLLLNHGANALVMNDDCQTPLDVARAKGFTNVVRAIEGHLFLFSGYMREFYGPGFLEVFAPQLLSRKVWVVVLPCGSRNPTKPFKLELAIYSSMQDAQPRMIIALWKANLEDPKFHLPDPTVVIVDNSSISWGRRRRRLGNTSRHGRCRPRTHRQTRVKLAPAIEGDKQQLQRFCDACKGLPQGMQPAFLQSDQSTVPATAPPTAEDVELAMAINDSIQTAMQVSPSLLAATNPTTSWNDLEHTGNHSGPNIPITPVLPNGKSDCQAGHENASSSTSTYTQIQTVETTPSAPPVDIEPEDGPIQYPSIDISPVDFTPVVENAPASSSGSKEDGYDSTSCVICLDAPIEGACVPCGHMAGCMSCLKEVKTKKTGCPICRTKIDQVIKVYTV